MSAFASVDSMFEGTVEELTVEELTVADDSVSDNKNAPFSTCSVADDSVSDNKNAPASASAWNVCNTPSSEPRLMLLSSSSLSEEVSPRLVSSHLA